METKIPIPYYQPLFDHMEQEHGLTLLDDEMYEIERKVDECRNTEIIYAFEWKAQDGSWNRFSATFENTENIEYYVNWFFSDKPNKPEIRYIELRSSKREL